VSAEAVILEMISMTSDEFERRRSTSRSSEVIRRRDEYWRWKRLVKSLQQLLDASQSISGVASDCGFFDQAHLTHTFQKTLGTTPALYRAFIQGQSPL
jgi:AraC-like DNA-binding protein